MKIHIKNGRVIDPASGLDTVQDVYVAAGRIVALGGAPADARLHASVAAAVIAVMKGANIVRCHDVAPTVEALKVASAVKIARL